MATHTNNHSTTFHNAAHNNQQKNNVMRRLRIVGIFAVIIIAIILIALGIASHSSVSTKDLPILLVGKVGSTDRWEGNNLSSVLIVEYSDYQCPACAAYNTLVVKAVQNKGSQFQFVYRNFPLKLIHAHAVESAQAAEAAGLQGKFWEMHDLLFERQTEWESAGNVETIFVTYANQLGLNSTQFITDLHSPAVAAKVENDYLSGTRYNIQATPTFYINGQPLKFSTYEELAAAIDRYHK